MKNGDFGEPNGLNDVDGLIPLVKTRRCIKLKTVNYPPSIDVKDNPPSTGVIDNPSSNDVTDSPNTQNDFGIEREVIKCPQQINTRTSSEMQNEDFGEPSGFDDVDGLIPLVKARRCINLNTENYLPSTDVTDDLPSTGVIDNPSSTGVTDGLPSTGVIDNPSSTDVTDGLPSTGVIDNPSSTDVTDGPNTRNDIGIEREVIRCLQRINTRTSSELDETFLVSEIVVRHQREDTDKGDPLGGFLCSIYRTDETNLHAFCTLDENGILAKYLHVKEKDILVSLNSAKLLESQSLCHEDVVELFKTLPIGELITMVFYNRKTKLFSTVEFELEGFKQGEANEDLIVKTECVKLTSSRQLPPTVKALRIPNQSKFLLFDNGRLLYSPIPDFLRDCRCHFIVWPVLNYSTLRFEYRYQAQKDKSKYLGIRGNNLELIDGSDMGSTRFQQEEKEGLILLKLSGGKNMIVCYNKDRGVYEILPHSVDLKPEHRINMVLTNCPV